MNNRHNTLNFGSGLIVAIVLCASWLVISSGCGQGPAVTRPQKPLPKTQEVNSSPISLK